jgi:hypothetical protein
MTSSLSSTSALLQSLSAFLMKAPLVGAAPPESASVVEPGLVV